MDRQLVKPDKSERDSAAFFFFCLLWRAPSALFPRRSATLLEDAGISVNEAKPNEKTTERSSKETETNQRRSGGGLQVRSPLSSSTPTPHSLQHRVRPSEGTVRLLPTHTFFDYKFCFCFLFLSATRPVCPTNARIMTTRKAKKRKKRQTENAREREAPRGVGEMVSTRDMKALLVGG